ncbi:MULTISPECIES: hypothetical protein [unclassified Lysobacter]|uniref:hypothetical protein n=1 Tax=unclassified Lysobacter TaxID=2635362 RepID=UPI001BE7D119|nr:MULTISPECIES: hypothetical protein [unclassified Lysobacter]MBT2750090.1 hypothetical protein [Lysobacter sp. ISL-50]MBT2775338.1 hypothetical protein [Lysobacter sp. ISL-54]MBT2783461.1 hypothetical protein [Lysobacter sp. ISL-52]
MNRSILILATVLIALATAGVQASERARQTSQPPESMSASNHDALLAAALKRDEQMIEMADKAIDAFGKLQTPPAGALVWLDADKATFAVREGASFALCRYPAVTALSDHNSGGNRVQLSSTAPSLVPKGEQSYRKAVPNYERASFGDCEIVVTSVPLRDQAWLVFAVAPEAAARP